MSDTFNKSESGERILSLDIFRGWTIILMILVNNPGSWKHVYAPLEHAAWDGWTVTDLIFPFFLWISGFSIPLSINRRNVTDKFNIYFSILRRSVVLILLGLFLSGFPFGLIGTHEFNFETWRLPGVLQRIGICYLVSASVYVTGRDKLTAIALAVLVLLYGMIMELFPVPGYGSGILTPQANAARYFDSLIFGDHTWSGSPVTGFDPEGAVSTLTSIASMMSGILFYRLLQIKSSVKSPLMLFTAGIFCIVLGSLFSIRWPVNKNLWSISYLFFTSGMAACIYSFLQYAYDFKRIWILSTFPSLYGVNAILVYVLSAILSRILIYTEISQFPSKPVTVKNFIFSWTQEYLFADPYLSSLFLAVMFILIFAPILWVLKIKKIHVRI